MRHEDVDSLTGLLSRRGLERGLREGPQRRSAAVIDVDDLKSVNDRYGHETGHAVLVEVARHLRTVAGQDDLLARAGGDEFYLVSSRVADDCATALEDALVALARGILANGIELSVTFSAGVTTTDPSAGLAAIRAADTAMYQAKSEGRGRVVVHGPSTVQFGLDRRPFLDRMARMHGQIEQLFVESRTDALTGAGNRLALDEQLDRLDGRTWPDGLVCAVLFVDIDHFHQYNHDHGDAEGVRGAGSRARHGRRAALGGSASATRWSTALRRTAGQVIPGSRCRSGSRSPRPRSARRAR